MRICRDAGQTSSSDESGPDVFVSRGDEEAGTGWQMKQVCDFGAAPHQVPCVPRPQEVVGV